MEQLEMRQNDSRQIHNDKKEIKSNEILNKKDLEEHNIELELR